MIGANPTDSYMFKVNIRNTGTRREICSKLTIKTTERCDLLLIEQVNPDWEVAAHLYETDF